MKEMPTSENPMEKIRDEALERIKKVVSKLRAEGFDLEIEKEPDTVTLELKTADGKIKRMGFMRALDFPNGKIEEVIEERVRFSETEEGNN